MKQTIFIAFFALLGYELSAQTVYLDKHFFPCSLDTSVYYYNVSERTQVNDTAFVVKISLKNSTGLYVQITYKDSSTTIKNGSTTFFEMDTQFKRSTGNYYNNNSKFL